MFKLVLLCDYSREPERRLLRGMSDFANTVGGWNYFQISGNIFNNPERRMEIADRIKAIHADAVFGRWSGVDRALIDSLHIPVILRTVDKEYPDLPMLSGDYREIGRMAASFFKRLHYDHFAAFGYKDLLWSHERIVGYQEVLADLPADVQLLETNIGNPDEEVIRNWLIALPKPIALFAANDVLALKVAELCLETGIRIPHDLSLLGVDNDDFLCNIASPKISSIHLDFERQGYELGEAIWRMSRHGEMAPVRIKIHPVEIKERESTLRHNIRDPYIRRIVEHMDEAYTSPLLIEDFIRDIPLSRRAIEMRFKKEMAPETLLSYLLNLRISLMCKLLETTDLPVNIAAEKSGFDDALNVGRTFKRYTGMSPLAWRREKRKSATTDHGDAGDKQD